MARKSKERAKNIQDLGRYLQSAVERYNSMVSNNDQTALDDIETNVQYATETIMWLQAEREGIMS